MAVIAYRDTDWIIGEPDTLFIVYLKVRDVVTVHFIVLVVIGNDIRGGQIRVYVYLIHSSTVCSDKQFFIIQRLYSRDADVGQAHMGLSALFGIHVIDINTAFKRPDE